MRVEKYHGHKKHRCLQLKSDLNANDCVSLSASRAKSLRPPPSRFLSLFSLRRVSIIISPNDPKWKPAGRTRGKQMYRFYETHVQAVDGFIIDYLAEKSIHFMHDEDR